jgi:hypothetical protein
MKVLVLYTTPQQASGVVKTVVLVDEVEALAGLNFKEIDENDSEDIIKSDPALVAQITKIFQDVFLLHGIRMAPAPKAEVSDASTH